jgi:hypothetical protein
MAKYSCLVDNLGAGAQIGIHLHRNGNYEFAFMKITQTTPCSGWIAGGAPAINPRVAGSRLRPNEFHVLTLPMSVSGSRLPLPLIVF